MKQVAQQHTPGPYEAWPVKNDRLKRWDVVCVNTDYCPGTGKTVLAERIRTEANARLFAAAPQLLERLRALRLAAIAFADDVYRAEGGPSENADAVTATLVREMLLAEFAIAKAEASA